MRLAIDADHAIQAITIDHVADVGAYPPCPAVIDPQLLPGPYKIPRLGFSMSMVWTNTMGKGAYRGPWMFETTAREMAIDHAARTLGIDPVELRRRNLLSAADLPFTSPGGKLFQEITPLETLEQALEILDYDAFRKEQAAARAEGRLLGLGFSVLRRADVDGRADAWPPRARRCGSRRAARSSPTSAPRRTARASRRRWPRSSPTPSASTTTTSPSSRPTPSRRRTARAPAAAARR